MKVDDLTFQIFQCSKPRFYWKIYNFIQRFQNAYLSWISVADIFHFIFCYVRPITFNFNVQVNIWEVEVRNIISFPAGIRHISQPHIRGSNPLYFQHIQSFCHGYFPCAVHGDSCSIQARVVRPLTPQLSFFSSCHVNKQATLSANFVYAWYNIIINKERKS